MARKKGPQTQQAYTYIKQKIQNFQLPPGMAVSDYTLEQELKMSRSPIREAIMRLSAEGLIESTGKGAHVTDITLRDIIEICQVRRAVEVAAVQILMENGGPSPEQKERLTDCFQNLREATEPVRNYYYDDQFHDLITTMCGNQRLVHISNQMRAQIYRARWLNCMLPERMSEAQTEHAAIYQALMDNDLEGGVRQIQIHLDQSEQNFRKILTSGNYHAHMAAAVRFGGSPVTADLPVEQEKDLVF